MALCPGAKELLKNRGHRDLSTHTRGTVIHAQAPTDCLTPPGVSHMQSMSALLASINCQLDTAENHLDKGSQLSNCLHQAGVWALCELVLRIGLFKKAS